MGVGKAFHKVQETEIGGNEMKLLAVRIAVLTNIDILNDQGT